MRRAVPLVALGLVMAGCESHRLTREPDPPISSAGNAVIVAATVLVGAGWLCFALRWLVGGRRLSWGRWVLGGTHAALTLAMLGFLAFDQLSALRMRWILDGGPCRAIALDERPRQIVQLTCEDGYDWGTGWIFLLFVAPLALLVPLAAWTTLRGDTKPLLGTVIPAGLLATLLGVALVNVDEWTSDAILPWTAAALVSAVLTACGLRELTRTRPAPPLGRTGPGRGRLVAGALEARPVDRVQAFVIDAVLVNVALLVVNRAGGDDGLDGWLVLAVCCAYLLAGSARGRTVGKWLLGLRVVDARTGRLPSVGFAAVRVGVSFGGLVAVTVLSHSLLAFVAVAAVLAGPMRQPGHRALHDHVAGTKVVRAAG